MEERLQKILSRAGLGSRRACEELIKAKRVLINGQVAQIGVKADESIDNISLDGIHLILKPLKKIYIAINKPRGVLSEIHPNQSEKTIRDFIDLSDYLFIVGRLDKESEGLLLLTNDGDIANQLTHPRFEHEKEYNILVNKNPSQKQLEKWRNGVVLPDGHKTYPASIRVEGDDSEGTWLTVIMHEGRKRQIREVGTILGLPVKKIKRIRISNITLKDLQPGQWRELTAAEVDELKRTYKKGKGT